MNRTSAERLVQVLVRRVPVLDEILASAQLDVRRMIDGRYSG